MVFALDEQPSAAGDAVLTNRLTKYGLDVKDAFLRFNPYLRLLVVGTQRNGITVAVVDSGYYTAAASN